MIRIMFTSSAFVFSLLSAIHHHADGSELSAVAFGFLAALNLSFLFYEARR